METLHTFGGVVAALRALTAPPEDPGSPASCSEVDRVTGLHRGHTWQIEQGKGENAKADTTRALARTFGVSVALLLEGGELPSAEHVRAAFESARAARELADQQAAAPASDSHPPRAA